MPDGFWTELIQNYAAYAAAGSGALAVLIYIYQKGIKPVLKAIREYNSLLDKVDKIFEEISPNGGTSIKDKVDSVDRKLTLVSERQRASDVDSVKAKFETDPIGNCIWVNRTYARLVERTPSELMGHGWQNAIASVDRDLVVKNWYDAANEDREFTMDFNFETPSGELIPCRAKSYRMTDSGGKTVGYSGVVVKN